MLLLCLYLFALFPVLLLLPWFVPILIVIFPPKKSSSVISSCCACFALVQSSFSFRFSPNDPYWFCYSFSGKRLQSPSSFHHRCRHFAFFASLSPLLRLFEKKMMWKTSLFVVLLSLKSLRFEMTKFRFFFVCFRHRKSVLVINRIWCVCFSVILAFCTSLSVSFLQFFF